MCVGGGRLRTTIPMLVHLTVREVCGSQYLMSGKELREAAMRGDESAVRDLLQRGAPVNWEDAVSHPSPHSLYLFYLFIRGDPLLFILQVTMVTMML